MPTEEQFDRSRYVTWRQSRDFKGLDFRNYIEPSFYQPLQNRYSFRDYLDMVANRTCVAVNLPYPRQIFDTLPSTLKNGQVSPVIEKGIYKRYTTAKVYYWADGFQFTQVYKLIPINEITVEMLTSDEQLTVMQELSLWLSDFLQRFRFNESEDRQTRFESLFNWIRDNLNYAQAIAIWVPTGGSLRQQLSAVTGQPSGTSAAPFQGSKAGNASALPLLLTGFGLVTGNLWLSGIGLLLRLRTAAAEDKPESKEFNPLENKRGL